MVMMVFTGEVGCEGEGAKIRECGEGQKAFSEERHDRNSCVCREGKPGEEVEVRGRRRGRG